MNSQDIECAQAFLSNLKHAARNHEKVKVGGGVFSGTELKSVAAVIESGMRASEADAESVIKAQDLLIALLYTHGIDHPETHRAEDQLRSLMSARAQQPSAKQSGVSAEMGCAENDQSTSFMNATLQGAGNDLAISIATHIDIPEAVSVKGEQAVAQHLKDQLSSAANAYHGLSFSVQIGPSDSAVKARPKNRP